MIIYKTTNIVNGKIYVGMDSHNNPNYYGSGKMINRAINKYGRDSFRKDVLEYCDLDSIYERERYWIKKLNTRNIKIGYNICVGGRGSLGHKVGIRGRKRMSDRMKAHPVKYWLGKKLSKEHRETMRAAKIGHVCSETTRKALLKANIGKPCSEEKRKKISEGNIKYWTEWYKNNKRPKSTCLKISQRLRGRKKSDAVKSKLSIATKNWWKRDRVKIIRLLKQAREKNG